MVIVTAVVSGGRWSVLVAYALEENVGWHVRAYHQMSLKEHLFGVKIMSFTKRADALSVRQRRPSVLQAWWRIHTAHAYVCTPRTCRYGYVGRDLFSALVTCYIDQIGGIPTGYILSTPSRKKWRLNHASRCHRVLVPGSLLLTLSEMIPYAPTSRYIGRWVLWGGLRCLAHLDRSDGLWRVTAISLLIVFLPLSVEENDWTNEWIFLIFFFLMLHMCFSSLPAYDVATRGWRGWIRHRKGEVQRGTVWLNESETCRRLIYSCFMLGWLVRGESYGWEVEIEFEVYLVGFYCRVNRIPC